VHTTKIAKFYEPLRHIFETYAVVILYLLGEAVITILFVDENFT
jgi:hypothetical protein